VATQRRRRTPAADTVIAHHLDAARALLPRDSTTGTDDPLVFIDGVRSTLTAIHSTLDRSRISSVEVLKGAAAIAEYGEDARRGVITITTTAPP
jgi:TonB-dependent SusC/RagA subfamily outer membrane receptor